MSSNIFFNAHHAPVGSFASMTFGCKGAKGGFGIELKGPADESIYIGVERIDTPGLFDALPFFETAQPQPAQDFDVEGLQDTVQARAIFAFADAAIARDFGPTIDRWSAGDLTFSVYSPAHPVPDPGTATGSDLKTALAPTIVAELRIDNRKGSVPRKAFLGYAGTERSSNMRTVCDRGMTAVGQGRQTLIATDDLDVYAGIGFQPEAVLNPRYQENLSSMLGQVGMLVGVVPAGEVKVFRFSLCFFREGLVTTGIEASYLYRRYFDRIEDVARFGLNELSRTVELCHRYDQEIRGRLSKNRAFMFAHALRSYLGSTQCLEDKTGQPIWVVNEGEYRMINTFDLTVDQIFYELAVNPWTVRNVLDLYASRYSYVDRVRFPGEELTHPGGLAFTHDMGVANSFSEPHISSYELGGLTGVFSYMSCEELVNWVLCACVYVSHTRDQAWATRNERIFLQVLESLVARDHPDASKRNGVMGLDSSRCLGGAEITTYDSLDRSLGQARNNLYLGIKSWAAYVLLAPLLETLGHPGAAELAKNQANLVALTVVGAADHTGFLPAVLGEGVEARIIPLIEGLVFPMLGGLPAAVSRNGPFGGMIAVISNHLNQVLQSGVCLFDDGGWRLSSTSRNSWLSKIYLCQYVAESVLGFPADAAADAAHANWLLDVENVYFAWSDQMVEGKAHGSRYYPRGVTASLWLCPPSRRPLDELGSYLTGALPTSVNASSLT